MIPVDDFELGRRIIENCTCQCGGALSLPWGGAYGVDSYVIRCAADPKHDRVKAVKSFYKMWKDGEELPSFIRDKIEWKQRRNIMEQENVKTMVVKQDRAKLAIYLTAQFPQDLNRETALSFAAFCIAHQLEPIQDCIPYHGNPYIRVAWFDRKAAGDSAFQGYSYKVYGKKEKEALDFDPRDLVAECLAEFEGLKKPLVGVGAIRITEREALSKSREGEPDDVTGKGYRAPVVHTHPQELLFKRARAAALRQRYHPPAPILEELPYTTAVETTYRVLPSTTTPPSKDLPVGGEKTGEQASTDNAVQTAYGPPPPPDQATKPKPAQTDFLSPKGKDEKPKTPRSAPAAAQPEFPASPDMVTPAHLKDDIFTFYQFCHHYWMNFQPENIAKELGFLSPMDLGKSKPNVWNSWLTIKKAAEERKLSSQ